MDRTEVPEISSLAVDIHDVSQVDGVTYHAGWVHEVIGYLLTD